MLPCFDIKPERSVASDSASSPSMQRNKKPQALAVSAASRAPWGTPSSAGNSESWVDCSLEVVACVSH